MYTKLTSLVLCLGTISSAAPAADLPSRVAPPIVPPPVFSWTGLYFGGQVGYNFGKSSAQLFSAVTGAPIGFASANPSGLIGGAHVGYQQELPTSLLGGSGMRLVLGVEGDFDATTARTNYSAAFVNDSTSLPVQGALLGRIGFASNRFLVYATGGGAFAYERDNYRSLLAAGTANEINQGHVGYTVGGGIEYAVSDNFSFRVEYRYTDYGRNTENLPLATPAATGDVTHRESNNRVLAGFSYKIDQPTIVSPVVARY